MAPPTDPPPKDDCNGCPYLSRLVTERKCKERTRWTRGLLATILVVVAIGPVVGWQAWGAAADVADQAATIRDDLTSAQATQAAQLDTLRQIQTELRDVRNYLLQRGDGTERPPG